MDMVVATELIILINSSHIVIIQCNNRVWTGVVIGHTISVLACNTGCSESELVGIVTTGLSAVLPNADG